ncbi:MAG: reverse transcriptase domain-containing protein, partial [Armatimonadota bacterium]
SGGYTTVPNDLRAAFSVENLRRAWLWIRTSTEPHYKSYFRDVYEAYAVAAEDNLADLSARLRDGSYDPKPACKLYFPKRSGGLRAYTLLGIEDQLTYQALANVIAERLAPRVRGRYLRQVFGHLYAGRSSKYFYHKWEVGYQAFSDAIRTAHQDGFRYAASFDLMACYDSICHRVLAHFLRDLGLEDDFIEALLRCLRQWTAVQPFEGLYQGHGIPQGPLPSGLLAETVLRQFDDRTRAVRSVRYFRYVDDVRLYGRDEHDLRHLLVELDLLSKSIGLFPQSGKICLREVTDVGEEIKSVSNPPEVGFGGPPPNQVAVRDRIVDLTRNYQVKPRDETRLKWALSQATPSRPLSRRLLRIARSYPHLHRNIARYMERHSTFTPETAEGLLDLLAEEDVYPAFCASFLMAALGRVPAGLVHRYVEHARRELRRTAKLPGATDLRAACGAWLLSANVLSYADARELMLAAPEWWLTKDLIKHVDSRAIGGPSWEALLNALVRDQSADVSIVAAYHMASNSLAVSTPRRGVHSPAELSLLEFGLIRRRRARPCGIDAALTAILGRSPTDRSWRTIFGPRYTHARRIAVRAKANAETDVTAWVLTMDTLHDLLLESLYAHDTTLGTYQPGNIGGVLGPSGRLASAYPALHAAIAYIHEKRLGAYLAHARHRQTGRQTKPIEWPDLKMGTRLIIRAYHELGSKW